MNFPSLALENHPVPSISVVAWITINCTTPETQKKVSEIKRNEVHEVCGETSRDGKYVVGGQTTENTRFSYACFLAPVFKLGFVTRLHDIGNICRILNNRCRWNITSIDIGMITPHSCVIQGQLQGRIVVRGTGLMSSFYWTVKPAAIYPGVTHKTIEIGHSRAICSCKQEIKVRFKYPIFSSIPNHKTFLL